MEDNKFEKTASDILYELGEDTCNVLFAGEPFIEKYKGEIEDTYNKKYISVDDFNSLIKEIKENINDFWTNALGQCICPECFENRKGDEIRVTECMFRRINKEIDNTIKNARKTKFDGLKR